MKGRASLLSDEDLVRSYQETGDDEYFTELFTRHRKRVFLKCHQFFAEWSAAEDATQETFLRTYRNLRGFRDGDFSGWLNRIARNVCIDEWRKRHANPVSVELEMAELPIQNRLDASLDMRRIVASLRHEMKSLAPSQQQCLHLKIQGYSYEESAARTGLSVDAVKSNLQNGRRTLWARMEMLFEQGK